MLVNLKRFSREHDVAVWLVAHPKKMLRGANGSVPPPGGYDISGSASFFNVPDAGITVSRGEPGTSVITNWKARFPWIGSLGECTLAYDEFTGVFSGLPNAGFWGGNVKLVNGGLDVTEEEPIKKIKKITRRETTGPEGTVVESPGLDFGAF